jgi:peptidoglycan/LPS O-acetylase OafA/YrhL
MIASIQADAPEAYGAVLGMLLPLLFVILPLSYFFIEKPAMRLGRLLAERIRRVPVHERAHLDAFGIQSSARRMVRVRE